MDPYSAHEPVQVVLSPVGKSSTVGDKGYSFSSIRRYLRCKGINYTIPRKCNQTKAGPFDKAIYRGRNHATVRSKCGCHAF